MQLIALTAPCRHALPLSWPNILWSGHWNALSSLMWPFPLVLGQYIIFQYIATLPTQYPHRYILIKYLPFLSNIAIIECISQLMSAYLAHVLFQSSQWFGVKTYSCVSLFYVCYCTSLIPWNPTHYLIWIYRQYKGCNIVPALLPNFPVNFMGPLGNNSLHQVDLHTISDGS